MSLPKTDRNKKIIKLRKKGWSFGELGKKYGITKQCIYQINQNPRWHQDHSFISMLKDYFRGMFK